MICGVLKTCLIFRNMTSLFENYVTYVAISLPILLIVICPGLAVFQFVPLASERSGFFEHEDELIKIPGVTQPSKDQIRCLLYNSKGTSTDDKLLPMRISSTPNKLWKKDAQIKVLIHGFHNFPHYSGIDVLQSNLLIRLAEDYANFNSSLNILLIDWSSLSVRLSYAQASKNTRIGGTYLAQYLIKLKGKGAIKSWDSVHLIGFSLGAHLAGSAGSELFKQMGEKFARITGLDPAGPEFDSRNGKWPDDLSNRLDKSDAKFVDILHCNMGLVPHWSMAMTIGTLGSVVQAGHADFYPNGGSTQIFQCTIEQNRKIACSHKSCVLLFAYSLKKPRLACPCKGWLDYVRGECKCDLKGGGVYMGEHCNPTARGKYFLYSRDKVNLDELAMESFENMIRQSPFLNLTSKW